VQICLILFGRKPQNFDHMITRCSTATFSRFNMGFGNETRKKILVEQQGGKERESGWMISQRVARQIYGTDSAEGAKFPSSWVWPQYKVHIVA